MRLVQVLIPDGKRETVLETLDERDIGYSVTAEVGSADYDAVVQFPLPRAAVESVLEDLRDVGIDDRTYVVVLDAETVISSEFDRLKEELAAEAEEEADEKGIADEGITGEVRIARSELQSRAQELVTSTRTYVLLTMVSAVIATAGMLLDSPATVVGSMVIAPLIGPSLAASVGTVLNDRSLFRRGLKLQILGILVAIVSATLFALGVQYLLLVPPEIDILAVSEISERANPNFLVLAIALGAGIAGIISLMTGVSTALVGVMIAVALIPPAAAVGLGIAFGVPRLVIGASVMVTVNVFSINLASLVTLWFEGYRPEKWFYVDVARGALVRQVAVLVVTIAILSLFLGGATYDSYVATTTEKEIRAAVHDELGHEDGDLELRALHVERTGLIPPQNTERVVVVVGVPPGEPLPQLAPRLLERIRPITNGEVQVEVEYQVVEQIR